MGKIYKHEDDSDDESQTPITPLTDMLLVRKKKKKKKKQNESEISAAASFLQEEQVPSKIKKSKVVDQGGLNNNNNSRSLEDFETPVKKKKKKKSKEYLSSPEEAVAKDKMETPVKKKNKRKHKELLSPSEEEAVVKDQRKVPEDTPKKKKRHAERDVSPESTPEKKKQHIEENGVKKKKKTKNETEELLVTPLKKKKKKKHTEEAEEILDTPEKVSKIEAAPEEQLSEDASNCSISPENGTRQRRLSKRLQDRSNSEQSSRRNSLQILPKDEQDGSEDYDCWNVEEEKLLVEKVLSVLGPKDRKVTYSKQLNQIDWNAIHLEEHDSADCKKKLIDLLKGLVKVKCLQTLGGELLEFFNDPKQMKASIATPFQRFYRSLRLRPGTICSTSPKEQWKNLPQEIKDVFINAYKKELAKYNLPYAAVTSRKSGPNTISLMKPVDFYVDHGLKTGGTHRIDIKKTYSSLSQEEKLPYIEEAIKVYVEYMKDVMKKEEDWDNRKGLRSCGLTLTDMKFFLKSKGMPERPQKPPIMYIKMLENQGKKVPALKNLLIDAQRIFAHIKEKEKKKYVNMYREATKNYKERMDEWKKKQDPNTLAVLDIINKEDPKDMKKSGKKSYVPSNRVATSQSKPLFIGEPVLPATTGLKYFSDIFNQQHSSAFRSKSERNEVRIRKWEKYSQEKRKIYEDRCKEAINEYKSKVLDYVEKMSDKEARIYLGFQRESICSHLKEDIFEDTYPNADYPIFTVNPGAKFNISTDDDDAFIYNEVALSKETEKDEDFDEEENVKSHKKTDIPRHQSKDGKNTKKKQPSSQSSEKGHMKQQAQKKVMSSEDSDESDVDNGNAAGSNIPVSQSDSDSEDSKDDDDATDDNKDDDDDDIANVTPAWQTPQSRGFVISKDGSEDSEDDSDDSSSD